MIGNSFCQLGVTWARQSGETKQAASDAVLPLAERTLKAIRNKDADFLEALADPAGIYVGFDSNKMSATQFRKELSEKRGVYCVIFDVSCAKGFRMSSASSLRQLLMAQPVTTTSAMEDAQEVSVTVRKSANPNEEILTLSFRHVGNRWKLEQIEYL